MPLTRAQRRAGTVMNKKSTELLIKGSPKRWKK
jgi:hypothetical protein